MLPPPASSATHADTDSTAELPTLDPAASGASVTLVTEPPLGGEAQHTRTDTWVLPAPSGSGGREPLRELEAQVQSLTTTVHTLTEQLRETREMLAGKNARLLQVERARDEAQAAYLAAGQRLAAAQAAAPAAAAVPAAQPEEASGERAAAERRIAELTAELAQLQATHAAQAARLSDRERHAASLATELQVERTTLAARATELEQARGTLADAERRAQQGAAQLAALQAQLAAAGERSGELQRSLQQLQSEHQTQHRKALQLHEAQTARGRAQGERVLLDLAESRARAASYFEALQSLEGRRRITEELLSDLHHTGVAREDELQRFRGELAARERLLREREAQLTERSEHGATLEQQLTSLNATLAHRDTQLRDAQREREGLQQSVTRLQGEVASGEERRRSLEAQLLQQQAAAAQQLSELQRLRTENQQLLGAVDGARSATAAAGAESAAHDAALLRERQRAEQAEAALGGERQRAGQLEGELATLRAEMDEWGGVLRSAQGHVASIEAAEKRARSLETELQQQRELTRDLKSQSETQAARVLELQSELQAATGSLERLEAQAHERGVRLEDLARAPRHAQTDTRHAATDTAANPALRDAARIFGDGEEREPTPLGADGNLRLLIYTDGGHEVVHVLGRKTSIGRTPDNDLQLDTKFVSRHHAVILAGPEQAIIEDLNSTNGVLVNGRRVTRHTLQEGDQIAIGRAHYRFALRRADKR